MTIAYGSWQHVTVGLLVVLAVTGCAEQKTLYQWEGYQPQVNNYFKGEAKEAQITALEGDLEKIKSKNGAVPPGYNAQLGLLYLSVGNIDQMRQRFKAEEALFPESTAYMEFLMKNAQQEARP
jgi:hypothetical protein